MLSSYPLNYLQWEYGQESGKEGFSYGSAGKESAYNVGDLGLIPGLGRSPGEGKGYHSSILAKKSSICSCLLILLGVWRQREFRNCFSSRCYFLTWLCIRLNVQNLVENDHFGAVFQIIVAFLWAMAMKLSTCLFLAWVLPTPIGTFSFGAAV